MRSRSIKKQVWLNKAEATLLHKKAKKSGMKESELLRCLITGIELKEKPDDRFYDYLNQLRGIGNNLNQISKRVNTFNFIDEQMYAKEIERLNKFILDIKRKYL